MGRYETRLADELYEIQTPDGWLTVGPFENIVDELGEVYEIEYTEEEASVPWLQTDDGVIRVDVRERLPELSFNDEFIGHIAETPEDHRVAVFTDMIDRIWASKGNLESY